MRRILYLILFLQCFSEIRSQNFQINGPNSIFREENAYFSKLGNTNTTVSRGWRVMINWAPADTNYISIKKTAGSCTLRVKKAATFGMIKLSYYVLTYDVNNPGNQAAWDSIEYVKHINVNPWIEVSELYVGLNNNVYIQDNNNSTGCSYNWSIQTPGNNNLCPLCTASGPPAVNVYIDPANVPTSAITMDCIVGCTGNMALNPAIAVRQVSKFAKLQTPVITGRASVGCGQPELPGAFEFHSTIIPGAQYYYWQLPPFLTLISGQGSPNIEVEETNIDTGTVYLTTYLNSSPNGNVYSKKVKFFVQVCCVTKGTTPNDVNNGTSDQMERAIKITANKTVYTGGSAIYHAGSEVKLDVGFAAHPNSYFHAYIQGCSGNFNRITSGSGEDEDATDNLSLGQSYPDVDETPSDLTITDKSAELNMSVFPNPNNGNFTLLLNNRVTGNVSISNELGLSVYEQKIDNGSKLDLSLPDLKQGIYILNLSAEGKNTKPVKLIIQ